MSVTSSNNRLVGIELIRFLSAFAILVWHYQHFSYEGTTLSDFYPQHQPFYSLLRPFYDYGHYAVNFFWCLSGFIFFWKYKNTISQKLVDWKKFLILRFSRLYPLHFLTLLAVAVLQGVYLENHYSYFGFKHNDASNFLVHLIFGSGWGLTQGNSFNGPAWSISVEIVVYAIFFLVSRYFGTSVFKTIIVVVIAIITSRLKFTQNPFSICLLYFYVGGLTALVYEKTGEGKASKMTSIAAIVTLVASSTVAFILIKTGRKASFTAFSLPMISSTILLAAKHFSVRGTWETIISALGNMTYSSYLLHFPLQLTIVNLFSYYETSIPINQQSFFCLYISMTFIIAYFCYEHFEMPLQKIIRGKLLRIGVSSESSVAKT